MDIYKQQRLLFVYMCGVLDTESQYVEVKHVSSLKYAFQEFEEKIYEIRDELKDNIERDEVLELFCILGDQSILEKADNIFCKSIEKVFDQIASGNFDLHRQLLDMKLIDSKQILDTFLYLYLKHLICGDNLRYPTCISLQNGDIAAICYYSNNNCWENREEFAEKIYSIWSENEKPMVLGRQTMTQKFMLDDLKGRRIIASMTDDKTAEPYLLLEGGLKLYLRDKMPYERQKISRADIGLFTPGEVETILTNPKYAFNKQFVPYEVYEDWQKVLIYILAVSGIQWKDREIRIIHQRFMSFIEHEICESTDVQEEKSDISKKMFYDAYAKQIEQIRKYFAGNEEAILSKDYILLMRTRYVFLPVLHSLVTQTFPEYTLFNRTREFCKEEYDLMLENLNQDDANEKGRALEDIAEYLTECSSHLQVMAKRLRTTREEIDLSCCNVSFDSDVWKFGALILMECKNWKAKVGVEIIRQMSYIMFYKGNTVTVLFASNGVTTHAQEEIINQAKMEKYILCIDQKELATFQCKEDFINMLIAKYKTLENNIEDSLDLIGI